MQCIPRSPPRLCLLSFLCLEVLQTARQGGHREGRNLSFWKEAEDLHGPPGTRSLLVFAQEAELFPNRGLGVRGWAVGGEEGRDLRLW